MTEYLAFKQIFAKKQNSLQPQKAFSLRRLLRWMACAKTSFPVPVSPVSKTVTSVAETFRANATACCIPSDFPFIASKEKLWVSSVFTFSPTFFF